jgi:rhamnosyltransferase
VKKVAILLATHNGENYLSQQVATILGQVGVDIFIYCSDDNSQDNTKKILHELNYNHANFEILLPHKSFGGAALNFYNLIKYVPLENFDYVAFADQDDIWFPNKISDAIDEMTLSNAQGFSSDIFAYWADEPTRIRHIRKSYAQTDYDYFFESPGPGCSQVMCVDLFEKFQKFVVDNYSDVSKFDYHDWLVYAFCRRYGYKWVISQKINMLYRQHQHNQIGVNIGISAVIQRVSRLRSGWYLGQVNLLIKMLAPSTEVNSFAVFMKNALRIRRKKVDSIFLVFLKLLRYL